MTHPSALLAMRQHLHLAGSAPSATQPAPDAGQIAILIPLLAEPVELHPRERRSMAASAAAHRQRDAVADQIAGRVEAFRAHPPMRTKAERFATGT